MHRGFFVLATFFVALLGIVFVDHLGWRSARALECLLLLSPLVSAAWATGGRLQNAAIVACSLVFGLALVQVAFLSMRSGPAAGAGSFRDEGLLAARDVVGWGPRHPGVFHLVKTRSDGHVVFDVHATIDDSLFRETIPSAGDHPIAFFGDSFVFGDGLPDAETLPQAFADLNHRRIPVLNFSFSGWAPSQNLASLAMDSVKSRLRRPLRLILFTATFHIDRVACKGQFAWGSGPRYVLDGGTVRQAGTCVGGRPRIVNTILHFLGGLVGSDPNAAKLDPHDVETYIKVVEAFASTARRDYGADTTILMPPDGDDDIAGSGFTQARIIDAWRAAGLDVLVEDTIPAGEVDLYQIPGDGHPTGLANRAIARQLENHLKALDPHALAD